MVALIALVVFIFYLPILTGVVNILERGNDLQEFFWPIFHFSKNQILENHTLPFWNNLIFSGSPLLPDPQSPLFYPPNIIFLFLSLGQGFIASFLLHTLLGGIGMYLCARQGFGFSKIASLFCASLYIVTPKLAGYLEAGHFGLVTSWAFLPFVILATLKLSKKPSFNWSILLGVGLAGIFYTHLLTFLISAVSVVVLWVFLLLAREKGRLQNPLPFFLSFVVTFGLIAITLLPQLRWIDHTTRLLLLSDRDVYPKWISTKEFLAAIFWPWSTINQTDSEKVLALGAITGLLALFGFWHLKRRTKVVIVVPGAILLALSLNNASPLYSLLLSQDWYVLLRVATRIWFLPTLAVILLAGYGFHCLEKKTKKWAFLLATLSVVELLALSWLRFSTPIPNQSKYAPREVYEFLQKDKERFRVFCLNRCLSQRDAARAGLELVEGYATLQQVNYYQYSMQLAQAFWKRYTLSIPPFEIYHFQELQPYPPTLADFNVKYVISPHELTKPWFILEEKIGQYLIYRNTIVQSRTYFLTDGTQPFGEAKILVYTPNKIIVDTSSKTSGQLVLAEVFSPGWTAFLDGEEETPIEEYQKIMRLVNLKQETRFVEFKYLPPGYKEGRVITIATLLFILGYLGRNVYFLSLKRAMIDPKKRTP